MPSEISFKNQLLIRVQFLIGAHIKGAHTKVQSGALYTQP